MTFTLGAATCSRSRTPRPPDGLGTPGLISSIPAFSSAETSFIEGIDIGPDHAIAGLHALDGRHRKVRQIGRLPLIDIEERASGLELIGGNHRYRFCRLQPEYAYTM